MSKYQQVLPEVFSTWMHLGTKEEASTIVEWLLEAGTSFAITHDRPYTLWLSAASLDVVASRTGL